MTAVRNLNQLVHCMPVLSVLSVRNVLLQVAVLGRGWVVTVPLLHQQTCLDANPHRPLQ